MKPISKLSNYLSLCQIVTIASTIESTIIVYQRLLEELIKRKVSHLPRELEN
jgi:hypothetical protein